MRICRWSFGLSILVAVLIVLVSSSATVAQRSVAPEPDGLRAESRQARGFTRKQLENVETRIATANAIVDRLQAEARAQGLASGWRQATLESLLALPLRGLQQVEQDAHSIESVATAIAAAKDDPNALGDPSADLVYTPFPPCRFIDTRNVAGKITAAAPRGYDLANSGNTYGGTAGCGLQDGVTAAIAMNVTIVDPSGAPGFLAIKPTLAAPLTSFMNWYEAGPQVQMANSGVVTVDQSGATAEFFIQVSESTHVIVDFFGVFAEPIATALDTTRPSLTVARTSGFGWNFFSPGCPGGYALTGGATITVFATNGVAVSSSGPFGNAWECRGQNNSGVTIDVTCMAICSRVPGR